ncbi:MAG: lysophospholipid acyltransferase family protein [Candidatus Hodarchaeota archaeon]
MSEERPELEERKERKQNPVVKFLTDTVIKPFDKMSLGLLDMVQKGGTANPLQYQFYLSQDALWYSIMKNLFDFEIEGIENIPPEGEPAIVCTNHQSVFDPIIFCVSFAHFARRRIHTIGAQRWFDVPFVGAYVKWCYAFPVRRGEHDVEAYNKVLQFLEEGELVGVYPEGTINNGGLNFLEPHVGAIRMAIDAKVPIIPLGITGSDKIMVRESKLPNLNTKLIVKIGKPMTMHEQYFDKPMPPHETLKGMINKVMNEIRNLLEY